MHRKGYLTKPIEVVDCISHEFETVFTTSDPSCDATIRCNRCDMPVYEYKCDKCSNVAERLRPMWKRHETFLCGKNFCDGTMELRFSVHAKPKEVPKF